MATIVENIQTLQSIKSDIKNAIIAKGGSVTDAFGGYAQAITDLPTGGGGDTDIEDGLIMKTLSGSYTNSRVTIIGSYTFYYCKNLTNVSFPNVTEIDSYAFINCTNLTSVSFHICSDIYVGAFAYCTNLTNVSFPLCSYIGFSAFANCTNLTSVSFPLCSYIGSSAFINCTNLTSVSFPLCSYIGSSAFKYCSNLTTVSFPLCSYVGSWAFQNCTKLSTIYLMSRRVVSLVNSNAFSSTPIYSKSGSIYVPTSLVDEYKVNNVWSYFRTIIYGYDEPEPEPEPTEKSFYTARFELDRNESDNADLNIFVEINGDNLVTFDGFVNQWDDYSRGREFKTTFSYYSNDEGGMVQSVAKAYVFDNVDDEREWILKVDYYIECEVCPDSVNGNYVYEVSASETHYGTVGFHEV